MTHEQLNLYLTTALAAAAVLIAGYGAYRLQAREDGQTTLQRLRKLETSQANSEIRQQGFQAEIEGVADHASRERVTLTENARRDYDALQHQIKDVPTMRDLVFRMVDRLETVKESNIKLDLKMDRIVELLTHK